MDEYDVLIREEESDEVFLPYLEFLNGLFKNSTLKPAIAMAYLTGILPIVRDKVESKLNEFIEFTILNPSRFAEFTGFTMDETKSLCDKYSMDFNECLRWYDGYRLNKDVSVCNPKAVVTAMMDNEFANYWSNTGSYENIKDYVELDFDGIRKDVEVMLGGGRVKVNALSFFKFQKMLQKQRPRFHLSHSFGLSYIRQGHQGMLHSEF